MVVYEFLPESLTTARPLLPGGVEQATIATYFFRVEGFSLFIILCCKICIILKHK